MKHIIILAIISAALTFSSCTQSKMKETLLPGVSGRAGEVLLVIDKKHYDDSIGRAFKRLLQEDTPGLPQSEPLFNLIHIPRKAMSQLFKIHRNIIITNISNQIEKPGIKVEYDKWAKPQVIITMVIFSV